MYFSQVRYLVCHRLRTFNLCPLLCLCQFLPSHASENSIVYPLSSHSFRCGLMFWLWQVRLVNRWSGFLNVTTHLSSTELTVDDLAWPVHHLLQFSDGFCHLDQSRPCSAGAPAVLPLEVKPGSELQINSVVLVYPDNLTHFLSVLESIVPLLVTSRP